MTYHFVVVVVIILVVVVIILVVVVMDVWGNDPQSVCLHWGIYHIDRNTHGCLV